MKLTDTEKEAVDQLFATANALLTMHDKLAQLACRDCWDKISQIYSGDHSVIWGTALVNGQNLLGRVMPV